MSASKLVKPSVEYKDSFLSALDEYRAEKRFMSRDPLTLRTDFQSFINALTAERNPHRPFQEWVSPVPETVAWFVKDETYIGTVEIRHRLNWHLERWGGHLHFVIRPSMRGKGFGKKILLKAIPIANYLGIDRSLLTVGPDNAIAMHVIESCGGKFADELPETDQFPARRRYWLDCT